MIRLTIATLAMHMTPATAAPNPDLSALVGRWQLDPALTHMNRFGPGGRNMTRSPTFTFVFAPIDGNLIVSVYEHYPQPAPTGVMAMIADGRPHPCLDQAACLTAGGDPRDQTYAYVAIDPHFAVRLFYISGKLSEYSTYAISRDGQTFSLIAWSPETPYWQNVQVFHKQP